MMYVSNYVKLLFCHTTYEHNIYTTYTQHIHNIWTKQGSLSFVDKEVFSVETLKHFAKKVLKNFKELQ